MVEIKVHYICDLCGDEVYVEDNKNVPKWLTETEVGGLCPACNSVWVKAKKDFVKKMRKDIPEIKKDIPDKSTSSSSDFVVA